MKNENNNMLKNTLPCPFLISMCFFLQRNHSLKGQHFNHDLMQSCDGNSHPIKQEGQSDKVYTCIQCNETFSTRARYDYHYDTRHPTGDNYQCDICQANFENKIRLKSHKELNHPKKEFYCEECNETFATLNKFRYHKQVRMKNIIVCVSMILCSMET